MNALHVLVVGEPELARAVGAACRGSHVRVSGPFVPSVASAAGIWPDVAIVDVDGPGGLEPLVAAGDLLPSARRLVVTDDEAPSTSADAIALGACGFLPVRDGRRAILDAIRRAAAGEIVIPAPRLAELLAMLGERREALASVGPMSSLTAREREVLRLVAEGASTLEVASALDIRPATVQSHVKNVLAKLGVHSKVEAVRIAWRGGVAALPAGL